MEYASSTAISPVIVPALHGKGEGLLLKSYTVPTAVRLPGEALKRPGMLEAVGRAVKYAYLQIIGEY